MMVRLGFAVAAHLEPDILIVDEVLAVGDAEFQKKAIGKMKEVSEGQGRTILFVSHNMGAIQNLCEKVLLIKNGTIYKKGLTNEIIGEYLRIENNEEIKKAVVNLSKSKSKRLNSSLESVFSKLTLINQNNKKTAIYQVGDDISFTLEFDEKGKEYPQCKVLIELKNEFGLTITCFRTDVQLDKKLDIKNNYKLSCIWRNNILAPGIYTISLQLNGMTIAHDVIEVAAQFQVIAGDVFGTCQGNKKRDLLWVPAEWKI